MLFVLWCFGFVSFHWGGERDPAERLGDAHAQITQAETLQDLSRIVREIKGQSETLDERRVTLQEQVTQLEHTREEIALSLDQASSMVAPSAHSRVRSMFSGLFSGVASNLVSSAFVGVICWIFGRRRGRKDSGS